MAMPRNSDGWCCLTPCPSPTRVKQRTLVKHRSRARLGANVGLRAAPTWIERNEHDFDNRRRYANDAHRKRRSPARNPTGRS